jgi:hypothetical protein
MKNKLTLCFVILSAEAFAGPGYNIMSPFSLRATNVTSSELYNRLRIYFNRQGACHGVDRDARDAFDARSSERLQASTCARAAAFRDCVATFNTRLLTAFQEFNLSCAAVANSCAPAQIEAETTILASSSAYTAWVNSRIAEMNCAPAPTVPGTVSTTTTTDPTTGATTSTTTTTNADGSTTTVISPYEPLNPVFQGSGYQPNMSPLEVLTRLADEHPTAAIAAADGQIESFKNQLAQLTPAQRNGTRGRNLRDQIEQYEVIKARAQLKLASLVGQTPGSNVTPPAPNSSQKAIERAESEQRTINKQAASVISRTNKTLAALRAELDVIQSQIVQLSQQSATATPAAQGALRLRVLELSETMNIRIQGIADFENQLDTANITNQEAALMARVYTADPKFQFSRTNRSLCYIASQAARVIGISAYDGTTCRL